VSRWRRDEDQPQRREYLKASKRRSNLHSKRWTTFSWKFLLIFDSFLLYKTKGEVYLRCSGCFWWNLWTKSVIKWSTCIRIV